MSLDSVTEYHLMKVYNAVFNRAVYHGDNGKTNGRISKGKNRRTETKTKQHISNKPVRHSGKKIRQTGKWIDTDARKM